MDTEYAIYTEYFLGENEVPRPGLVLEANRTITKGMIIYMVHQLRDIRKLALYAFEPNAEEKKTLGFFSSYNTWSIADFMTHIPTISQIVTEAFKKHSVYETKKVAYHILTSTPLSTVTLSYTNSILQYKAQPLVFKSDWLKDYKIDVNITYDSPATETVKTPAPKILIEDVTMSHEQYIELVAKLQKKIQAPPSVLPPTEAKPIKESFWKKNKKK